MRCWRSCNACSANGRDGVRPTIRVWPLAAAICALTSVLVLHAQPPLVQSLLERIRVAMAGQLPGWTLTVAEARTNGWQRDDLFVQWQRGQSFLDVTCQRHETGDEALAELRSLRRAISAGVPAPLPGVADEAYYIGPYGRLDAWTFYFARRTLVCTVGSAPEHIARQLMEAVIKAIDES
jgi:hypothetical protein